MINESDGEPEQAVVSLDLRALGENPVNPLQAGVVLLLGEVGTCVL
jgi:hypothetical protein